MNTGSSGGHPSNRNTCRSSLVRKRRSNEKEVALENRTLGGRTRQDRVTSYTYEIGCSLKHIGTRTNRTLAKQSQISRKIS